MHGKKKFIHPWYILILTVLFLSVSVQTSAQAATTKVKGNFYLVGISPGDPDLTTIRAIKIIQKADLIICHKGIKEKFPHILRNKEVLGPPAGVHIWNGYGKKASDFQGKELERFRKSEEARGQVSAKVRGAIKKGKTVAVLSSGDPLIYGPWSWCLEEFQDLDPVVVPGISCFNAAHAALKKDVTWSDTVKSTILTANDWPGTRDTIEKMASNQVTMVIFTMGLELKDLIAKLSTHYPPHTPIAIVCDAGYKEKESVISGTLETILDKTRNKNVPFEHLVYVGENLNFKWKK